MTGKTTGECMNADDSQEVNQTDRSDLRTRIANALRNMTGDLTYEAMADAVIRELKLEPEYRFFPNDPPLARYVTEWEKADDE